MKPYLSHTAYATPAWLAQLAREGQPLVALMHVTIPHGKTSRHIEVELDRADLLKVIANAADALRLLDDNQES